MAGTLRILQISDLHCGPEFIIDEDKLQLELPKIPRATAWFAEKIVVDIRDSLHLLPDYITICGDLGLRGKQYVQEQTELIDALIEGLNGLGAGLSRRQVIIVPGNHDLAVRSDNENGEADAAAGGSLTHTQKTEKFKRFFDDFYQGSATYEPESGFTPFRYPENGIMFIGLDSCIKINDTKAQYGYITPECFKAVRRTLSSDCPIRIAVFHHCTTEYAASKSRGGADDPDRENRNYLWNFHAVRDQLISGNVRLYLHGHRHSLRLSPDQHYRSFGRGAPSLEIGAGSLGHYETAPKYNLIELEVAAPGDRILVDVHSRRFDRDNPEDSSFGTWTMDYATRNAHAWISEDVLIDCEAVGKLRRLSYTPDHDLYAPEPCIPREGLTDRLEQILKHRQDSDTGTEPSVVILHGFGGSGKTSLATQAMKQLQEEPGRYEALYGYSFYLEHHPDNIRSRGAIDFFTHTLTYLAQATRRRVLPPAENETDEEKLCKRLLKALAETRSVILMDGLETMQESRGPKRGRVGNPWLWKFVQGACSLPESRIVITTRINPEESGQLTDSLALPVGVLSSAEARELLVVSDLADLDDSEFNDLLAKFPAHALTLLLVAETIKTLDSRKTDSIMSAFEPLEVEPEIDHEKQACILEKKLGRVLAHLIEEEVLTKPQREFLEKACWSVGSVDVRDIAARLKIEAAERAQWIASVEKLQGSQLVKDSRDPDSGEMLFAISPAVSWFFQQTSGEPELLKKIHSGAVAIIDGLAADPKALGPDIDRVIRAVLRAANASLSLEDYQGAWEVLCMKKMDDVLYNRGEFEPLLIVVQAIAQAIEAQKCASWHPNPTASDQCAVFHLLGRLERKQGHSDLALKAYDNAISTRVNQQMRAGMKLNKSYVLFDMGRFRDAADLVTQAEKGGETRTGRIFGHRGRCLAELRGQCDGKGDARLLGLEELSLGIKMTEGTNDERHLCTTFRQRAEAYIKNGELDHAENDLIEAKKLAEEWGFDDRLAQIQKTQGDRLVQKKAYILAREEYEKALNTAKQQVYHYLYADVLLAQAKLACHVGDTVASADLSVKARDVAELCGYLAIQTGALLQLAQVAETSEERLNSLVEAEKNIAVTDSYWDDEEAQRIRALL